MRRTGRRWCLVWSRWCSGCLMWGGGKLARGGTGVCRKWGRGGGVGVGRVAEMWAGVADGWEIFVIGVGCANRHFILRRICGKSPVGANAQGAFGGRLVGRCRVEGERTGILFCGGYAGKALSGQTRARRVCWPVGREGRGKCRSSGEVLPFGASAQGAFGG